MIDTKIVGNYQRSDLVEFWSEAAHLESSNEGSIVYLAQGPNGQPSIASRRNDRTRLDHIRDFIHLPKRSIVDERLKLSGVIRDQLERLWTETKYDLPSNLEKKLFSSRKYRDVTVGDMKELIKDIRKKVERQPDGVGEDAFPREQWNKLIAATEKAIHDFGGQAKAPRERNFLNNLYTSLKEKGEKALADQRLIVGIVCAGLLGVWTVAGPTAAVAAVGFAAGMVVFRKALTQGDKPDHAKPAELVDALVDVWSKEFKDRTPQFACNRNLMLLSSGERFISDVLSEVGCKGSGLSQAELRAVCRTAFKRASSMCGPIELRPRRKSGDVLKLIIDGQKYVEEKTSLPVEGLGFRTFFHVNNKDTKVIVREFFSEDNSGLEVRLRNNAEAWNRTVILERAASRLVKARSSDQSNQLMTGYLGAIKLENGYIGQVFRDDWHLPSFKDVLQRVDGSRQDEMDIIALLNNDRARITAKLVELGIPAHLLTDDAFRIDRHGNMKCNLGLIEENPLPSSPSATLENVHQLSSAGWTKKEAETRKKLAKLLAGTAKNNAQDSDQISIASSDASSATQRKTTLGKLKSRVGGVAKSATRSIMKDLTKTADYGENKPQRIVYLRQISETDALLAAQSGHEPVSHLRV